MKAKELKQKYLDFFKKQGHAIISSASLIPTNDPSVLFNTAGMQPLVPYLLGQKHPLGNRLANVQKCLRTVDFDNIGDNTHHTFFQMLGNWSLGDYFKKESIAWSFEFLTSKKWLNLSLTKLAFTVYKGDDDVPKDEESAKLWLSLGVSKERIAYLGKDNFWSAGDTGPCGPSTEIFYWAGDEETPQKFDAADNRWVEIWNNVFMTYNRKENGTLELLKQKNVDTGMGLERTLAVLSGKKSAYETDLFQPIIKEIEKLSGKNYEQNQKIMRIIADHLRASVFILGDDNAVIPSNVDRGYILRRLIRKAIRLAKLLNLPALSLNKLAEIVIKNYSESYLELKQNKDKIISELKKEEEKFEATLEKGLKEFARITQENRSINAKEAFFLFQSYGFPIEMTEELAAEKGVKVDKQGFEKEYEKHQELSRVGAEKKFKGGLSDASEETRKLHTATHLLNEALRKILKEDIKQKGSNITPERLRFDFNFDRKLTPDEIKKIESEVNRIIKLAVEVKREELPLEKALSSGAHGEFGTKYPPKVSVYAIGDYSKEICMGPHANNTSELGKFKIVKEESSAAGVRRIKAVLEK
ncbi:MAG: alanine--tRNA ligase [Nanoarchaeota archaeon]